MTKKENEQKLKQLYEQYENCNKCPLHKQGRKNIVFGQGNPNAKLMLIGEGPGYYEDIQGVPFVGRSGQLLNKILTAMKLTRKDIFISNVVKCRPPSNRTPLADEINICKNLILFKEIEIIQPKIICSLGACATQALLGNDFRISKSRGTFFKFNNRLLMPTFHPAYLLRNPHAKRPVWEDMKKIMTYLQ